MVTQVCTILSDKEPRVCQTRNIIEFPLKSGKHSTWTLSLFQNRVRLWKKNILSLQTGGQTQKCTTFCAKLSFNMFWNRLSFFPERLHWCYIYFHCPYIYNYYNYHEPCALNAEFQHFIPRFNKTSFLLQTSVKEGIGGEKQAQRQGEDRMTLRKTFMNEVV